MKGTEQFIEEMNEKTWNKNHIKIENYNERVSVFNKIESAHEEQVIAQKYGDYYLVNNKTISV